jgi:hypothetical protein
MSRLNQVVKELRDRKYSLRLVAVPRQSHCHTFKELVSVAHQQVIFVTEMRIESGATDIRTVKDILNSD